MINNKDSTNEIIPNSFNPVTRSGIECNAHITYEQAMSAMSAMFRAISQLTEDKSIIDLCEHGELQAKLQGNDIDCLREGAGKAGVIGELVPEIN